jgi:hypothetical protein
MPPPIAPTFPVTYTPWQQRPIGSVFLICFICFELFMLFITAPRHAEINISTGFGILQRGAWPILFVTLLITSWIYRKHYHQKLTITVDEIVLTEGNKTTSFPFKDILSYQPSLTVLRGSFGEKGISIQMSPDESTIIPHPAFFPGDFGLSMKDIEMEIAAGISRARASSLTNPNAKAPISPGI